MARVLNVVFKELTASDFYWINQPGLERGGGQSYIDFDTSDISRQDWRAFFHGIAEGEGASGPFWKFSVRNLGAGTTQSNVKLGQRRSTSFSIRSQKLPEHSSGGRRLQAWSPHHTSFPAIPPGTYGADQVPFALIAQLRIFLIRDDEGCFWAGWTRMIPPEVTDPRLKQMFERKSGIVTLSGDFEIDPTEPQWPFKKHAPAAQEAIHGAAATTVAPASESMDKVQSPSANFTVPPGEAALPDDDSLWDPSDELSSPDSGITYSTQQVRKRNQAAARAVRKLYKECQITGSTFLFMTSKGRPYLEVHHLIPLGKGGADSPHNMIVVSAQAHKMLHHAEVSSIDLTQIQGNQLHITINGQPATITWHPMHAALVQEYNPA